MSEQIEQIKNEIVDKYIEDFKEELNIFSRQIVSWMDEKLKKILLSSEELEDKEISDLEDLGWRRKALGIKILNKMLFVGFSDKIFNFLKEKKQELLQAETKGELDKLRRDVLGEAGNAIGGATEDGAPMAEGNTDSSGGGLGDQSDGSDDEEITEENNSTETKETNTHAIKKGAITTAGGLAGATVLSKGVEKYSKINKYLSAEIRKLKLKLDDPRLIDIQKDNIKKTIKELKKSKESFTDVDNLKIWKKLSDEGILSVEELGQLKITSKDIKKMNQILDNKELIESIEKAQDTKTIKRILSESGIVTDQEKIAKILKKGVDSKNLKETIAVLGSANNINTMARVLRAVPFLDMVAMGFDVFTYINESKEADLIKEYNKVRGTNKQAMANVYLASGIVDASVGVVAILVSSGPVGWIALGVAVGGYATTEFVKHYYFDVRNTYMHNKEDYKKLLSTQQINIKQAILQATVRGEERIDSSSTEKTEEFLRKSWNFYAQSNPYLWLTIQENIELFVPKTLEDAYRSLIYHEELETLNLVKLYNPEFPKNTSNKILANLPDEDKTELNEQRKTLKERIDQRMKYVQNFLPKNNSKKESDEYSMFIQNIQESKGISTITDIIAESKLYSQMKSEDRDKLKGANNIQEYKEKYKQYLQKKNPRAFYNLENIYKQDKQKFIDIYYDVRTSGKVIKKDCNGGHSEYQNTLKYHDFFIEYFNYKYMGKDIAYIQYHQYTNVYKVDFKETVNFLQNLESATLIQSSHFDKPYLERMYSLDGLSYLEIHNLEYTSNLGQNIIYRLAKEQYGYTGPNDMLSLMYFFPKDQRNQKIIYYHNGRFINKHGFTLQMDKGGNDMQLNLKHFANRPIGALEMIFFADKDNIDTNTERVDEWLDKEMETDILNIIRQERLFQGPEKKAQIEQNIQNFVSKSCEVGKYIRLPYYLMNNAIRAGIGNMNECFFTIDEQGKVLAFGTQQNQADSSLNFESIEFDYEQAIEPINEVILKNNQKLIQEVEYWRDKLKTLDRKELKIPSELQEIMNQKMQDWDTTKDKASYWAIIEDDIFLQEASSHLLYFKRTYMGMLATISHFKFTNNISNIKYMTQAWQWIGQEIIKYDDKGNLTLDHLGLEKDEKRLFLEFLDKKYQDSNSTVLELLQEDENRYDYEKGQRMAEQILLSIFEVETLYYDKEGNISSIHPGKEDKELFGLSRLGLKRDLQERIDINLSRSFIKID